MGNVSFKVKSLPAVDRQEVESTKEENTYDPFQILPPVGSGLARGFSHSFRLLFGVCSIETPI
jgi:hypothetical protein